MLKKFNFPIFFKKKGECFRRDEIDASHYPVFHQMEVVRALNLRNLSQIRKNYKFRKQC